MNLSAENTGLYYKLRRSVLAYTDSAFVKTPSANNK